MLYALVKKIKGKAYMAIPVVLYAVTISAMLAKAFRYCIGEWLYGMNDNIVMLFLTVALGAVLFVLSDGSLGMILFAGQKKNRPLKIFNITTYFAAQILLASSIFFVFTPVSYTHLYTGSLRNLSDDGIKAGLFALRQPFFA